MILSQQWTITRFFFSKTLVTEKQVENKKRKKEKKEKKNKKHKKEHVEETPVETNAVEEVATEPINVPIEENGHANGEGRKHKKKKHKKELDNQNGHEANGENEYFYFSSKLTS